MPLPHFEGRRILVIGDLMLDEYVWGDVNRISPEAPVQVVSVEREAFTLGGAGNVVNNLTALGASVSVAGVVGDGEDGRIMMDRFAALGADASGVIRETGRRTTRKTRVMASNQHVVRIDRETVKPVAAETHDRMEARIRDLLPSADIVLVSDYDKGLLAPPFLGRMLEMAGDHGKRVLCDPKGRNFSKYRGADLITPNRKEAALASGIDIRDDASLRRAADAIMDAADLPHLLITQGKAGMTLFGRDRPPLRIPAEARQVFDVSGAGDTVLSVVGLSLAAGALLEEAARLANTAAGIVVGKVGAAAVSRAELESALGRLTASSSKFRSFEELPALSMDLRGAGRRIVLTNGCFDLLHTGHIMLFGEAKRHGDVLIVAVDDDASVTAVKGPGRPVIGQDQRIRLLSALDAVDYVTVFSQGQLDALVRAVGPDVLLKGSNYEGREIIGREAVEAAGGQVVFAPTIDGLSADAIIDHIRRGESAA